MPQKKRTENQKIVGQRSYNRAQARKAEDIAEQDAKRKANDAYRAKGERTPYQERKRASYLARIAKKYGKNTDD